MHTLKTLLFNLLLTPLATLHAADAKPDIVFIIAVDLGWEKTFGRMTLLWPKDMGRTPALLGEIVTKL